MSKIDKSFVNHHFINQYSGVIAAQGSSNPNHVHCAASRGKAKGSCNVKKMNDLADIEQFFQLQESIEL